MKTEVTSIDSLHKSITVELPWDMIAEEMDRALRDLSKDVSLKGFRKGKIPRNVIKQRFGGQVREDVLGKLIADSYDAALIQHHIQPVARPELDRGAFQDGAAYSYTARVEVRPEIELKQVWFDIPKKKAQVDAAQIDAELDRLREMAAVLVPIEDRNEARQGDTAIVDYTVEVDGKALEGGESKNYQVDIGSQKTIPGFEDQLVGLAVGASKEFTLPFPKDYGTKNLASKDGHFRVQLTGLKKRELPEKNDEFVKDLGREGILTLVELQEDIQKRLLIQEQTGIDKEAREELITELIDANPFPVPPAMLKRQQEAMVEEMETYLSYQGISPERIGLSRQKMKDDVEEKARREVQAILLLATVAEREKISVDNAAIDAHLDELAGRMGKNADSIKSMYQDPSRRSELAARLRQDKVLDHLLDRANIEAQIKAGVAKKPKAKAAKEEAEDSKEKKTAPKAAAKVESKTSKATPKAAPKTAAKAKAPARGKAK